MTLANFTINDIYSLLAAYYVSEADSMLGLIFGQGPSLLIVFFYFIFSLLCFPFSFPPIILGIENGGKDLPGSGFFFGGVGALSIHMKIWNCGSFVVGS